METFQLIGYVGAFAIGLIMGSTGSGGSAMAVPIFNYLFLMDMHSATAHFLICSGDVRFGRCAAQCKKTAHGLAIGPTFFNSHGCNGISGTQVLIAFNSSCTVFYT